MTSGQLPLKSRSSSRYDDDNPKNWEPNNWRNDSNDFSRWDNFNRENRANEDFCQLEKVEIVHSDISCETISLRLKLDFKSEEIKVGEFEKNENKNVELRNKIDKKMLNLIDEKEDNQLDLEEKNKKEDEECNNLENEIDDKVDKQMHENVGNEDEEMKNKTEKNRNNQQDENSVEKSYLKTKNYGGEYKNETNKRDCQNLPVMSSLTQKKMDDLLKSLRERMNALEHEEKTFSQFGHKTKQMNLENRTHEKSGSLANYKIPIGPEVRPSFAERIQEIWVDNKTPWSMVGKNKLKIYSEIQMTPKKHSKCNIEEEMEEELKINNYSELENAKEIEKRTKSHFKATNFDFEIFKPIVCHVGVQYEIGEFKNPKKSLIPEFEKKIEPPIKTQKSGFETFPKFIPINDDEKKTIISSDVETKQDFEKTFAQKNDDSTSSFTSKNSKSKMNSPKSRSLLNFRHRTKLKNAFSKIQFKPPWNSRPSIFQILKPNQNGTKRFSKEKWFFTTIKQRSKMTEKCSKLFVKSKRRNLKNFQKFAHSVKNMFSCIGKTSAIKFGNDFPKNLTDEPKIEQNEENSSKEHFDETSCLNSPNKSDKDFSLIENPEKIDFTNKAFGSMTKLSVTTSNSTNITLQLRGSTSDTRIVPSDDLRLNLAPCLVESCSEIMKTNSTSKLGKNSNNLDVIPAATQIPSILKKCSAILEKNYNLPNTMIDEGTKNRESTVWGVEKFLSKKTIERSKPNLADLRSKRESERKNRQILRKDCFTTRTETLAKKDMRKTSSASSKTNSRLQRRKSVIDMKVDKLSSEQTKKVDVPNGRTQRSKCLSIQNNAIRKINPKKNGKIGVTGSWSERSKQRIDSPIIPRKAVQAFQSRGKSSLIPIAVEYKNLEKKQISADPKNRFKSMTSLNLSPPSLLNILNVTSTSMNQKNGNSNGKSVEIETKNHFSSPKSSESRTILKNTPPNASNSKPKKNSENRVHFEFNGVFPMETISRKSSERKMIDISKDLKKKSSEYDRKMDDRKIVKRIQSSLETGVPLKRITITDPHVVAKKIETDFPILEMDNFLVPSKDKSFSNLRPERTVKKSVNRMDKRKLPNRSYRRESPTRRPNLSRTLEKYDSNGIAISYHPFERKYSHESNETSEENETENFKKFSKIDHFEKSERSVIVDLTSIKEKLDNDIIERTSRTSGTEDNDCAIILIKAINSSMQLSDD